MKIVASKHISKASVNLLDGLGLATIHREMDDSTEKISFECKRKPNEKHSPTFTIELIPYEDGDAIEVFLQTREKVDAIAKGQNLKTNAEIVGLVRQAFTGSVLDAFEAVIKKDEDPDDYIMDKAYLAMTQVVFPPGATRTQKRALRKIKKPIDLSFRKFGNRLIRLNEYFPYFPPGSKGTIPKPLPEDELVDIMYDALPKVHYRDQMRKLGFDPADHSLQEFINWVEERCEPFDTKETPSESKMDIDKPIPRKNKGKKNKRKAQDHDNEPPTKQVAKRCSLHGPGRHTTDQCKVLKEYIKKLQEERANKPPYKSRNERKKEDFHYLEGLFKSEDFHSMLCKEVGTVCNKFFRGFKRDLEQANDEDHHMVDDMAPDEHKAYTALLSLNKSTSDSSDEGETEFNE